MCILQKATPKGYVSTGAYIGIYYEGIGLIIYAILLINLYRIYRASKQKLTFNLLMGFTFFMLASFFSWISKWYLWHHDIAALEGPYWLQIIYTFKVTMACVVIGNFFIYKFYRMIFSKEFSSLQETLLIIYKIILVIFFLLIHIPVYLERSYEILTQTEFIVFLLTAIDTSYAVPYSIKCFKASRNEAFGKKYFYIGITALFILNVLVMSFFNSLLVLMRISGPFGDGYTVFYFIAFGSAIVALTIAIYGYVLK